MTVALTPAIDRSEAVRSYIQTDLGKAAIVVSAALLYLPFGTDVAARLVAVVTACTVLPHRRRLLVTIGTLSYVFLSMPFRWDVVQNAALQEGLTAPLDYPFRLSVLVAVLGFLAIYHRGATATERWGPLRRPVGLLVTIYLIAVVSISSLPISTTARCFALAFLIVLGKYLWFFAYSLADRRSKGFSAYARHLGFYVPFWGSTHTPYPKGPAYLRKVEATTPEELAISQLKGLKLLWWALLLSVLQSALQNVIHGSAGSLHHLFHVPYSLRVPQFWETFYALQRGEPFPWYVNWQATASAFAFEMLQLTIFGHTIIATCRLCGFNAMRNTYRPLESRTLVDFWNRYYFYYKELLVTFFFLPTFLRYFRQHPRLRVGAATMAAACGGNFLFHYLRDIGFIMERGWWGAFEASAPFLFYCLVLGVGITWSQLRRRGGHGPKPTDVWWKAKLLDPFVVLAFYCILGMFIAPGRDTGQETTLLDHFRYLGSLLNLGFP